MGQAHEVTTQFLGPGEQCAGILGRVGATTAIGLLLMDGDSLEEDGLAVEQDLLVARLDGAETDLIGNSRIIDGEFYLVELGVLGRPEF